VVPLERCALGVLATCVSRPAADRAVLDCGSKALALDRTAAAPGSGPLAGHGVVCDLDWRPLPGTLLERLSEEHGVVALASAEAGRPFRPGAPFLVVPNHACVVVNLFDRMHGVRGGWVEEEMAVDARGHAG
jgi:D-serine deaminase-like pyridoxal phosphate-dependent protein